MPTASSYASITATVPPVYRGGPAQGAPPPTQLTMQSLTASFAWGSEGGEASLTYDYNGVPVEVGMQMVINAAGHVFYGVCTDSAPFFGSGGQKWEVKFRDNLYNLGKDQAYCAFNKLDDHIVNNRRVKRYVHYLPDLDSDVTLVPAAWQKVGGQSNIDFLIGGEIFSTVPAGIYFGGLIKAYTNAPLTAAQIIILVLNSIWTNDTWTTNFHPDQFTYPVFDVDSTGGGKITALFQSISDQQGLVFAQVGAAFNLMWVRKGQLDSRYAEQIALTPAPEINPATGLPQLLTDDRVLGQSLSSNPTQVRILGDRNTYMVLNVPLVPGWSPGWEQYYQKDVFLVACYNNGSTSRIEVVGGQSFPAGTKFTTIGGPIATVNGVTNPVGTGADPEGIVAYQLALEFSESVTVAQFATLMGEALFEGQPNLADYLKYADKSRLDMPAVLYIDQILFRAFQFPDGFTITNQYGVEIPLDSLEVLDKQIARITYDPITGEMEADPTVAADGNGLALVQGYQVAKDLFAKINPSRFDLTRWNSAQDIWATQDYVVDDNGEPGGKTILFTEPIIKSASLVKIIGSYGVLNANPVKSDGVTPGFDTANVQIGLCFSGERYSWLSTPNPGGRLETVQIGGLNRELIGVYGESGFVEVLYSDGLSADQKAQQYVFPIQLQQYVYDKGGYRHALLPNGKGGWNPQIQLNPFIDRIQVVIGPDTPAQEIIDLTSELPKQFFTPERDNDRNVKLLTLLPGQQQLRQAFEISQLTVKALEQSKDALQTFTDAFSMIASEQVPLVAVSVQGGSSINAPVGTPLFGGPLVSNSDNTMSGTYASTPAQSNLLNNVFMGVTVKDGELIGGGNSTVRAQRSGVALMRVLPPVKVGDELGQVAGKDYLSPNATVNIVGVAQQAAATPISVANGGDGLTALISVLLGASAPAASALGAPFEILKVSETQVQISNQSCLLAGLDAQTTVPITGLGQPFDVDENSKIYLEVLFDLNGNAIMANIAASDGGWRVEIPAIRSIPAGVGFPLLCGLVDNTNLLNEENELSDEFNNHILSSQSIVNDNNETTARAALALFKNLTPRYNQFYAYCLIGFCTPATNGAEGLSLAGTDTPMTVVQSLDENLMLQGFCQAGTPVQIPMPYAGPFATTLPAVTITLLAEVNQATEVTLTYPNFPQATINFSFDGEAAVIYYGTLVVSATGSHTIIAWATQTGFIQSPSATQTFTV